MHPMQKTFQLKEFQNSEYFSWTNLIHGSGLIFISIQRSFALCSTGVADAPPPSNHRSIGGGATSLVHAALHFLCGRHKRATCASVPFFFSVSSVLFGYLRFRYAVCPLSTKRKRLSLSDNIKILQRVDILGYIRKLREFVSQQLAVPEAVHRNVGFLDSFAS